MTGAWCSAGIAASGTHLVSSGTLTADPTDLSYQTLTVVLSRPTPELWGGSARLLCVLQGRKNGFLVSVCVCMGCSAGGRVVRCITREG